MSGTTIWDQVLSRIEDQVGRHSFSTWFKPTSLLADDGPDAVDPRAQTLFVEWLPKHYSVVLAEAMRDAGRPDAAIVFVPDDSRRVKSGPGPDASKTTAARPGPPFETESAPGRPTAPATVRLQPGR